MTIDRTDLREDIAGVLDDGNPNPTAAWWARNAQELLDQLDQAEARIQAVREWHWGDKSRFGHYCAECGGEYPCDTIRALDN